MENIVYYGNKAMQHNSGLMLQSEYINGRFSEMIPILKVISTLKIKK